MATNEIKQTVKIEASLTQIQAQLKTLEGNFRASFGNIQSLATSALGVFGVGFGVAGLVAFGKNVVNVVGHLQDLAEQTGINAQTLSGLKPELENAGISIDSFAKGVLIAQKTLGEGTEDVKKAVRGLGLDLNDLANSSPDEFLDKVTAALARVGNEFDRKALSAKIFGRAGAETANVVANLAGRLDELRGQGLDAETIRNIDALGDSINSLTNSIINFAAAPISNFFNFIRFITGTLTEREKAVNQLDALADKGLEIAARLKAAQDLRAQGVRTGIASDASFNALLEERDKIMAGLTESTSKLGTAAGKTGNQFKNLIGGADSLKKQKAEVDNFLQGLEKQLATLEGKQIELTFGADVALAKTLDQQLATFKENLRNKQIPIPKGLDEFFTSLRDRIVASNAALADLNQGLEEITARQQAFADAANEGVGITVLNKEDVARDFENLKRLTDQFKELQKALAIEILPEDKRAAAEAVQEFEDRVKAINEWRDAAIRAGQDVATVNAQAAQATADAWVAAGEKMKKEVDENNEFVRRAFERGFDAVSDSFRDLLDGNITSLEDFAEKVRKTLNSLVADFLTLKAKEALLGEDFGKQGAGIGGILGDLLGTNKPEQQISGTSAADLLDAERGQELLAAAQAGLQATSVTAETGIQALSAQAQATLQTSATAAQTGIQTTGATAQAGIEAVKVAALAAIQAASAGGAAGGGSGLGGALGQLFGDTSASAIDAGAISEGGGLLALGYHGGGLVTRKGEFASFKRAVFPKLHNGGEVTATLENGEFVLKKWSASRIGKPRLDYMNETGTIPADSMRSAGGRGGDIFNFSFNGVQDMDSFRRSRQQLLADLGRAVRRADRQM